LERDPRSLQAVDELLMPVTSPCGEHLPQQTEDVSPVLLSPPPIPAPQQRLIRLKKGPIKNVNPNANAPLGVLRGVGECG